METTQVVLHTNLIKILFGDHEKTPTSNKYKYKNALLVEKIMRTHPTKNPSLYKGFLRAQSPKICPPTKTANHIATYGELSVVGTGGLYTHRAHAKKGGLLFQMNIP